MLNPIADTGNTSIENSLVWAKLFARDICLAKPFIFQASLPVVFGIFVGQRMRDKIAPETFKKLVLIAVIATGADLLRHGFFS